MSIILKSSLLKILVVLVLLTAIGILVAQSIRFVTVDNIVNYPFASIYVAAAAMLVLYCLKSLIVVIPISVLYISTGILFPTIPALIIAFIGVACSLSIGYLYGKKLGEEKVQEVIGRHKKVEAFLTKHRCRLMYMCFISRLSPLPFDLFSMFSGAVNISFGKYLLFSLLGISVKMVPLVLAGSTIISVF